MAGRGKGTGDWSGAWWQQPSWRGGAPNWQHWSEPEVQFENSWRSASWSSWQGADAPGKGTSSSSNSTWVDTSTQTRGGRVTGSKGGKRRSRTDNVAGKGDAGEAEPSAKAKARTARSKGSMYASQTWQPGNWRNIVGEGEFVRVLWPLPMNVSFPAHPDPNSWLHMQFLADACGWSMHCRTRVRGHQKAGTVRNQTVLWIATNIGEARACYKMLVKAARKVCPRGTPFVPSARVVVRRLKDTWITDDEVEVSNPESVDSEDTPAKQQLSRQVDEAEPSTAEVREQERTEGCSQEPSTEEPQQEAQAPEESSDSANDADTDSDASETSAAATAQPAASPECEREKPTSLEEPASWCGPSAAADREAAGAASAGEAVPPAKTTVWDEIPREPPQRGWVQLALQRMFQVARLRVQATRHKTYHAMQRKCVSLHMSAVSLLSAI